MEDEVIEFKFKLPKKVQITPGSWTDVIKCPACGESGLAGSRGGEDRMLCGYTFSLKAGVVTPLKNCQHRPPNWLTPGW